MCFICCLLCFLVCFFFFKQKTAYEMRISDWSSDVCSSDLQPLVGEVHVAVRGEDEIVAALEAFEPDTLAVRRHLSGLRIELQDPVLEVGDEDAAVLVNLQAVRLAVVFGAQGELFFGREAKYSTEGDVDDVQVGVAEVGRAAGRGRGCECV